jgi:hypothetical protein
MNVSLSSLDLKYLIRKTVTEPGGVDVRQFYQSGLSGPAAWANAYFYLFSSRDVSNLFASPRSGGLVRATRLKKESRLKDPKMRADYCSARESGQAAKAVARSSIFLIARKASAMA